MSETHELTDSERAATDRFEERRDPGEIVASLHEDMRRQRVFVMGLGLAHAVLKREYGLSLLRPMYDMAGLTVDLNPFLQPGIDRARQGTLIPDSLGLMFSNVTGPASATDETKWTENVVLVDPAIVHQSNREDTYGYVVNWFEREMALSTGRPVLFGPLADAWTCWRMSVATDGWAVQDGEDSYVPITQVADMPDDVELYEQKFYHVLALCALLATSPTTKDTPPSFRWESMNRGRAKGGLAALPPLHRVLNLNRVVYPSGGEHTPTGREMPKHFRRGTFRKYKAPRYTNMRGQTGPVRATIVRRDKDGELPGPSLYIVKDC